MLLRLGIYEKSAVNEVTLRSDGTVAEGPFVVELLPHAAATSASTPAHALSDRLLSFRTVIYGPPDPEVALPVAFFPDRPGRECAGKQDYSDVHRPQPEPRCWLTIAHARKFVKRSICSAPRFVQSLDKPDGRPMIATARDGEEGRWDAHVAPRSQPPACGWCPPGAWALESGGDRTRHGTVANDNPLLGLGAERLGDGPGGGRRPSRRAWRAPRRSAGAPRLLPGGARDRLRAQPCAGRDRRHGPQRACREAQRAGCESPRGRGPRHLSPARDRGPGRVGLPQEQPDRRGD